MQSQVLDGETLLLAYSLGEERSFLWALSKTNSASSVLLPRAEIEQAVQRVLQSIDGTVEHHWQSAREAPPN